MCFVLNDLGVSLDWAFSLVWIQLVLKEKEKHERKKKIKKVKASTWIREQNWCKKYIYVYSNYRTSHEKTYITLLILPGKLYMHFNYHLTCFIWWLLSKQQVLIQFVFHYVSNIISHTVFLFGRFKPAVNNNVHLNIKWTSSLAWGISCHEHRVIHISVIVQFIRHSHRSKIDVYNTPV